MALSDDRRRDRRKGAQQTSPTAQLDLHCSLCKRTGHLFRSCPLRDDLHAKFNTLWYDTPEKGLLFDTLAGGGSAPTVDKPVERCSCRRGVILVDAQTRREVGEEVFFYDSDEEAYFLHGKRLSRADLAKVDWNTPRFSIPERYIGPDRKIHGTIGLREYCSRCESVRRGTHDVTFQWTVRSRSGRRQYAFKIEPHASRATRRAFTQFTNRCWPRTPSEYREFMLACFLLFGEHSSLGRESERRLAARFKVTRGRLRSIRARYERRLRAPAVQPEH